MLNNELLAENERETQLNFAWAGNLGHWYWNIESNSVVFNHLKTDVLGYTSEDLPEHIDYAFFTDKLHPDDYEGAMNAMRSHMYGEADVYEVEYRIQCKDGSWKWFYDRGKVTQRSDEGRPLFASGIVSDITDKKEQEEYLKTENKKLEIQSFTDPLTGIRNRRSILFELENRVEQANTYKTPLSIVMFDIDLFKSINDTFGHTIGDEVLKTVARIISDAIRGLDTVGRYGGEEFLCIFPNTSKKNATHIANRILRHIRDYDFGIGRPVTISGGVKKFSKGNARDFVHEADINLYAAKEAGRDCVVEKTSY